MAVFLMTTIFINPLCLECIVTEQYVVRRGLIMSYFFPSLQYAKTRDFLKELRPWHYLVIYGELGYGKKWLALDACCDYSVIKAMDYKIFWLDVHNCNSQEKDLEKLQR